MPKIKAALPASLRNVAHVLKNVAASLFGYAVSHKSIALSDSKACTITYLCSKL